MRREVISLLSVAVLAAACAKATEPEPDKNTNWLRECSGSRQCGAGMQCVCGVCTSVCDRDEQCALLDPDAVCAAVAGDACGSSVPALCTVSCAQSGSCQDVGEALVCSSDTCMPEAAVAISGQAQDAGPEQTDGAAGAGDAGDAGSLTIEQVVADACGAGYACVARVLGQDSAGDVKSFAVDGDYVYWADFGTFDELGNSRRDGAIVRMPRIGGSPERVQQGLDRPFRVWRDGERTYWLTGDPLAFAERNGMHALYESPLDASQEARVVREGSLLDLQVTSGSYVWLERGYHEALGDGYQVNSARLEWDGSYSTMFLAGEHWLATADGLAMYLQRDGADILRVPLAGGEAMAIEHDPVVSFPTADGDKLWVIHTDNAGNLWVAWMPSEGGPVTHVAAATGGWTIYVGTNVVWTVTVDGPAAAPFFTLNAIPKTGGELEPALRWPRLVSTDPNLPLGERDRLAAPPVLIPDGDDAWVYAYGTVVHVQKP